MFKILSNRNLRIMAVYYTVMGAAVALASPLIPSYVVDVGLTMSDLGLAASVSAFLTAIFLPTVGYIGDKYNRKYALLFAVFFRLIALGLFAFSQQPFLVLAGYALNEFGFLIYLPIARAIISDAAGEKGMGKAYGELISIVSLIEIIFPTLSGQIFNIVRDYHIMFQSIFFIALFATPILLFLEDSKKTYTLRFKDIFKLTDIEKKIYIPATIEGVSWRIWIFLLYVVPKQVLGVGPDIIGFAYTIQSSAWFASQYFSGYLVDRVGAKKIYILSDFLGIPIALLYTFYLTPITFMISTGLFGLSISLWIPSFTRMVFEASTEETRAITYAKVDSLRYLFGTPASVIGGNLYDLVWMGLPFMIGVLMIAVNLGIEYKMFPDI